MSEQPTSLSSPLPEASATPIPENLSDKQQISNEFDALVLRMLEAGFTQAEIEKDARKVALERSKSLPPVEVLYSTDYGGFELHPQFIQYIKDTQSRCIPIYVDDDDASRTDPFLIQGIVDYGAEMCRKLPGLTNDIRLYHALDLDDCRSWYGNAMLESWEKTQPGDLVAKAKQFLEGRLAVKESQALDEYAKANPDWQLAKPFCEGTFLEGNSRITKLLLVRHLLDDNRDKYLALCMGRRDLNLKVGLIFAVGEYGQLAVAEVPGGVKYRINEYDGLEHVIY